MGKHFWKFDCGIYPVVPGLSIKLGDYGFWEGPQWCHKGNIEDIKDYPIYLTKEKEEIQQDIADSIDVDIDGGANAGGQVSELKAGMSLNFKRKNSQYFLGKLTNIECYVSIDQEVEPFLKRLSDVGIWKPNYWLAYTIYFSNQFVTLRSKTAGAKVSLSGQLGLAELKNEVALSTILSKTTSSIEHLACSGAEPQFAGAKFISLEKNGHFFSRKLKIKYNVTGMDEISFG